MSRILIVLMVAASWVFWADAAHAHTPNPRACDYIWQLAEPGEKFSAKKTCLAAQRRHSCVTHQRTVHGRVTVKGKRLMRAKGGSPHWRNQRKVIAWLVNEALRRNLPKPVLISAIATTTQESSARELSHGHGTSVGPFQLINTHGSAARRRTIQFSGNWYYNGAIRVWRRNDGRIGVVELSHAVQRSRYPRAVARWVREATRTTNIVLAGCTLPAR